MNDIYADGIANVAVGNGVVRVDLVTQRFQAPDPQSKESRPPKLEVTHHLVMALPGFMNALALMEQVRAQLIKDGTIQVKPKPEAAGTKVDKKA